MRPIPGSPEPGDRPWLVALWFVAIVVGAMLMMLAPSSTGTAAVGTVVAVVGVGVAVAGTARVLRENQGRRVPWLGSPPVRPRRWDLLTGTGASMVFCGIMLVTRSVERLNTVWTPLTVGALLVAASSAAVFLHNRRVTVA